MSNVIHPTAVVADDVTIGDENHIGPYAVVENGVVIGNQNKVAAQVVLKTGTILGNKNVIHEHAVLSGEPQDLKFNSYTKSYVKIGDQNVIREAVTINRGSQPESATIIGNNNFLMYSSHLGHDCVIGNHNVIVTSAGLAGHVTVADRAFISGGVMIHQFTNVGTLAMLGGNAKVTQDSLPYMIIDGNPARVRGLNLVGLRRAGCAKDEITILKEAYRILFSKGLSQQLVIAELDALNSPYAQNLANFIRNSQRGYHRV